MMIVRHAVPRHAMAWAIGAISIPLFWYGASVPWGMSPIHLIPFVAPGVLLGLGWAWMTAIIMNAGWTSRIAARWACIGGVTFPPLLALYIPLEGDLHPESMLSGFVLLAWVVLAGAALVAGIRMLRRVATRTRAIL